MLIFPGYRLEQVEPHFSAVDGCWQIAARYNMPKLYRKAVEITGQGMQYIQARWGTRDWIPFGSVDIPRQKLVGQLGQILTKTMQIPKSLGCGQVPAQARNTRFEAEDWWLANHQLDHPVTSAVRIKGSIELAFK